MSDTFKRMFPDSKIGQNFCMGKTKGSYVICHGLAPHFKSNLQNDIMECQFYVIAFDESLNKVSQKCQMDLFIRFWSNNTEKVETRYWTSVFLGRSTAENLLEGFLKGLENLDQTKLLQVSMDGPNVNLSFMKKLKAELDNGETKSRLMDIGVVAYTPSMVLSKLGIKRRAGIFTSFCELCTIISKTLQLVEHCTLQSLEVLNFP